MKTPAHLGFLILLANFSTAHGGNLPVPSSTGCVFYKKLESELECSKSSAYLLEYGYRYCQKFQESKRTWKDPLAGWVPNVTFCLQNELVREPSRLLPCSLMEDTAFSSHPTCYMQSGFCKFGYVDMQRVLNVVAWADIQANITHSVIQSLRIGNTCDLSKLAEFLHIIDFFFGVTRSMDEYVRTAAAEIFLLAPTDPELARDYANGAYAFVLTGERPSDTRSSAKLKDFVARMQGSTVGEVVETCKASRPTDSFCEQVTRANPGVFESAGGRDVQVLMRKNLAERIVAARKLINSNH